MKNNNKVFISGWGFKSSVWDRVADHFSQDEAIHKIALSDISAPFAGDEYNIRLAEKIPPDSIVVAWSLAGLLILQHYPFFANKVKKLFLVAASPCFYRSKDWPGIEEKYAIRFSKQIKIAPQNLMHHFKKLVIYPHENLNIDEHLLDAYIYQHELSHQLDYLLKTDARDRLNKISFETHFILGNSDAIVPDSLTENFRRDCPKLTVSVIKGAGHIPFITHESEFVNILRD